MLHPINFLADQMRIGPVEQVIGLCDGAGQRIFNRQKCHLGFAPNHRIKRRREGRIAVILHVARRRREVAAGGRLAVRAFHPLISHDQRRTRAVLISPRSLEAN